MRGERIERETRHQSLFQQSRNKGEICKEKYNKVSSEDYAVEEHIRLIHFEEKGAVTLQIRRHSEVKFRNQNSDRQKTWPFPIYNSTIQKVKIKITQSKGFLTASWMSEEEEDCVSEKNKKRIEFYKVGKCCSNSQQIMHDLSLVTLQSEF